MKNNHPFLKIAKVKTVDQFYQKYPSEAAFFKAHPEAKKMANGGEQDKGQLNKLDDLTNFTNYNDLPEAGLGDLLSKGKDLIGKAGEFGNKLDDLAGKAAPFIGPATNIIGGIGALGQEKKQLKQLKQDAKLTGVMAQAAESRPEPIRRQYVRPEDVLIQPDQMFPSYGTGTNILSAQDGAMIGGNLTEIQNTYDPNAIYTNLGYEPLDDSNQLKSYYTGGKLTKAQDGFAAFQKMGGEDLVNNMFTRIGTGSKTQTGSSQLGKGIGSAIGTAVIPIPGVGGLIGGALGSLVGGLFGRKRARQMANYKKETSGNIDRITGQQTVQGIQNQYQSYMEDGGYVSNDWNPQVIAKFGEYDVDQLFAPDETMNTLRTGGQIRSNYMFDTDKFAMGGDLKVYRGEAESISTNPYLPDGGETVMFRGPSHANGGMPIQYGQSPVEVEGGEPAVKLQDGGTGEDNMVVFGNLKIPNEFVNDLDPKAKGRKFKNYIHDLSKVEAKQNKIIDKSVNTLDNLDVNTSFDQLKLSSLQSNLMGANMKLKNIADKKQTAAALQSAINDTAKEHGIDADALSKGKMKKDKNSKGKAALGDILPFNLNFKSPNLNTSSPTKLGGLTKSGPSLYDISGNKPYTPWTTTQDSFSNWLKQRDTTPFQPEDIDTEDDSNLSGLTNLANQIIPLVRPSNAEELNIQQILPELSMLGEKEEPVYAQKFQPNLLTPFDVVDPQAQLNIINSQATAAIRAAGNNPAAQAYIMGQVADMKNKVIGEAQQANRANYLGIMNKNTEKLDDAELKNLTILDTQQSRQAQAKSNTKANKFAAQQSIASKYLQNRNEQKGLQTYENLYNYRFGDEGRAQNFNPLAQFNIPQVANMSSEELEAFAKFKAIQEKKKGKISRNGSIVKALKNL